MKQPPVILCVGGFDGSGGAGILTDIKTVAALGGYGIALQTSLTIQNTQNITAIYPMSVVQIVEQWNSLFSDFDIAAIKIGMLYQASIIYTLSDMLKMQPQIPMVLDPIFMASNGTPLLKDEALNALVEKLFPLVDLLTPNFLEAKSLYQHPLQNQIQIHRAMKFIASTGPHNILLKGGHVKGKKIVDYLYNAKEDRVWTFVHERIDSRNTHGTGCTLSSAVATFLALGHPMTKAVASAIDYTYGAIQAAQSWRISKGNGPLNHFWNQSYSDKDDRG